jgi:Fe-S-cluster containining protein
MSEATALEQTEFLCARCARHMETCCQTSEVYVTPGDVERIADHVGGRDFYEFRPPDDPIYLQQDDDPIWPQLVFKRPDGMRRVLRRRPGGDCTFLGEAGCTLPLETRPLICRIYPFDFNEQGIHDRLANGCPLELLRPGMTLLEELDMRRDDAERWRQQLYAELPQERTANDYRSDV